MPTSPNHVVTKSWVEAITNPLVSANHAAVTLDNIDAGSLTFACTAYVNSPRDVGAVKSALLFEILDRLRDARLPLTRAQNMVVRNLPPLVEDVDAQG